MSAAKEAACKAGQLDAGMDANESLISRYARPELMTDGKLDIQKIIPELMGAEIAPLQYHAEMLKYYEAGKSGQNIESVFDSTDAKLTEDMKQAAYAAGLQDRGKLTSDGESGIVNKTLKQFDNSNETNFSIHELDKTIGKALETGIVDDSMKFANQIVRKYYKKYVESINSQIDSFASLEQRARQAFELRNKYRTNARKLMSDTKTREYLDQKRRNKTFDELIQSKMSRKGLTYEEALKDIIDSATRTNSQVNSDLGVE